MTKWIGECNWLVQTCKFCYPLPPRLTFDLPSFFFITDIRHISVDIFFISGADTYFSRLGHNQQGYSVTIWSQTFTADVLVVCRCATWQSSCIRYRGALTYIDTIYKCACVFACSLEMLYTLWVCVCVCNHM